jgi:DNA invertase Pin-like site-specific DNA recombinase
MNLFYARVSTKEQNEARQVKSALEIGVEEEHIYIDKASGKNTEREQLKKLLSFARKGDIVFTESISRIARNTKDLLCIVDELSKKDVDFVSLKENIDTRTPQGKFMLTVFAAMAELERECILQRQREGIEIAKEQGKFKGKPKVAIDEGKFKAICKRWRAGEITATESMKMLDLKPNTFYRRVKEFNV